MNNTSTHLKNRADYLYRIPLKILYAFNLFLFKMWHIQGSTGRSHNLGLGGKCQDGKRGGSSTGKAIS